MTVARASPDSARPMAREGVADSRTSTIKLWKAFSPVCQDREKRSEVMFETTSLDKSGSAATKGEKITGLCVDVKGTCACVECMINGNKDVHFLIVNFKYISIVNFLIESKMK